MNKVQICMMPRQTGRMSSDASEAGSEITEHTEGQLKQDALPQSPCSNGAQGAGRVSPAEVMSRELLLDLCQRSCNLIQLVALLFQLKALLSQLHVLGHGSLKQLSHLLTQGLKVFPGRLQEPMHHPSTQHKDAFAEDPSPTPSWMRLLEGFRG